ncbi:MAG: HAMP domain-containing protein [Chloroflexi bacterium]|nr:HAMP domain-containing protein [Chloroflexota bacterium]
MDALRRRASLRWLIAGGYVLGLVASVAVLGAVLYFQVDGYLWRAGEARLREEAELVWRRTVLPGPPPSFGGRPPGGPPPEPGVPGEIGPSPVSPGFPLPPQQALPGPLRRDQPVVAFTAPPDILVRAPELARNLGSRELAVRILTPDGGSLAVAGGLPGALGNPPEVPGVDYQRVLAMRTGFESGRPIEIAYFAPTRNERWQVLLLPVQRNDQLVSIVQVATSRRAADDLLRALAWYLAVGGIVATVLGVIAGGWIARSVARPLERLAATTQRVATGDLEARTGLGGGRNEVYAVAAAFDDMVARLQATFAAQRRFVADASHELKTPLTAISGMAELLRIGADGGRADQRELALVTIEREVERMSRLVGDLLTLSRAEQRPHLVRPPVDLSELVGEAAGYARLVGKGRQIMVAVEPDVWTPGDRDELTRVLRNLVGNAMKYTPPEGTIRLVSRVSGDAVELVVNDNGAGISAEDLPHVFDRFYRADPSRTRKTGGSGLGLAIVRAIVEWHGGDISIASELGAGTSVTVRLPRAATPLDAASAHRSGSGSLLQLGAGSESLEKL